MDEIIVGAKNFSPLPGTAQYPPVIGEFETVDAVLAGKSLARFGDGEFKLVDGKDQMREPRNEKLAAELSEALHRPAADCLVAIPTMDPNGPKIQNWLRHRDRFARIISRQCRGEKSFAPTVIFNVPPASYYSAFITRPDSAPWINCLEFALKIELLWKGKRAAVLSERDNSILKVVRLSAKRLKHVACPHREAYAEIDKLERAVIKSRPDIALLSCGPTATCLANRLAAQGVHAVDIGSAGGFILKLLAGRRGPS